MSARRTARRAARGGGARRLALGLFFSGCGEASLPVAEAVGTDADLCPAYCALATAYCQAPMRLFSTLPECQQACAALPAGGELGAGSGDTVACRLTYLMAQPRPDVVMCTYARPTGSPACF